MNIRLLLICALVAAHSAIGQVSLSWLRTYAGPMGDDGIESLAILPGNHVLVAGRSQAARDLGIGNFVIMEYDSQGNERWLQRHLFNPAHVADKLLSHGFRFDSTGAFYMAGATLTSRREDETLLVKFAPDGRVIWQAQDLYPGSLFSSAYDFAVDSQDNIWVVGQAFFEALDFAQLAILKYSPTGQLLWRRLYDGPSREARGTPSIALDRNDRAYIATSTPGRAVPGITSNSDFLLIKYSPSGERLWERRFDGPVEGSDFPRCIAFDPRGFILVGGNVDINPAPEEQSYALALLRYTMDGDLAGVWMNLPDDQLYHRHHDYFRRLAVGLDGSIGGGATYFPPNRDGFVPNGTDIALVRFGPDFNFQWLRAYNTVRHESGASDVLFDAEGNVYGCGQANKRPGEPDVTEVDALVLKYSPEGNLLWSFRWNHPVGNMVDTAYAIALDSRNNIVAGGWTQPFPNAPPDFLTFKLCQIQGDADRNGQVDGADIELVIERFGLPGDPETASGDLNGDGIVDDTDLAIVLWMFGETCP